MTHGDESDSRRRKAPFTKRELMTMNAQVATMNAMVDAITIANEMVKRGEAATIGDAMRLLLTHAAEVREALAEAIDQMIAEGNERAAQIRES
jgi:hypothetical protein